MNTYYYIDKDGYQAGPVDGELLKQYGVGSSSFVWCEGMPKWQKVSEVSELKSIFCVAPPPFHIEQQYTPPIKQKDAKCPENHLVWAILSTVLCCWPLGIPAIIYASKVDILWNLGDEEGARKKAEQAETWSLIATVGGVFAGIIVFMCTLLTT